MLRVIWTVAVCLIGMVLLMSSGAQRSFAELPGWVVTSPRLVGEARFRLFFFDIYHASLFAPDGQYDGTAPYALKLSYMRDVSSQTITEASLDEMRRQGVSNKESLTEWANWMEQNFPDMQNGDEAIMVALPEGGMAFYHNSEKRGQTDDLEFAKAFFAIWLSDDALKPDLSRRLRGLTAE